MKVYNKFGTTNVFVAENICRAVSSLVVDVTNQQRLGAAGVCKGESWVRLIIVISLYQSFLIPLSQSLIHLCIPTAIVVIFETHGATNDAVADCVSAALRRLAMNTENRIKIGDAGGKFYRI